MTSVLSLVTIDSTDFAWLPLMRRKSNRRPKFSFPIFHRLSKSYINQVQLRYGVRIVIGRFPVRKEHASILPTYHARRLQGISTLLGRCSPVLRRTHTAITVEKAEEPETQSGNLTKPLRRNHLAIHIQSIQRLPISFGDRFISWGTYC